MSTALATIDPAGVDQNAILRSVGLNVSDPKAQALLLVCRRYELDPLLKHVVLIQGAIYITRDGLLCVAHASKQLDGIVVESQGETPTHYIAKVAVYRKDMSHPFTYVGRYPKNGSNKLYGPEMAVKCAEVMSLRRAFNVSMAAREEMWDQEEAQEPRHDVPDPEPARKPAPSRERPREAAAASKRGKDERTCWEVIEAGIASYQERLVAEYHTPEARKALNLTTYQVQRHLVKHRLGKATTSMGNAEVSHTLEGMWSDPKHRSALLGELKSYLQAAYLDARRNYAGEVLDATGEAAGDAGDDGDPDVDYPDEPGANG